MSITPFINHIRPTLNHLSHVKEDTILLLTDREQFECLMGQRELTLTTRNIHDFVRFLYSAPRFDRRITVFVDNLSKFYSIHNTSKLTNYTFLETRVVQSEPSSIRIHIPANTPLLFLPRNLGGPNNLRGDLMSYRSKGKGAEAGDFVPFIDPEGFRVLLPPHLHFEQIGNNELQIRGYPDPDVFAHYFEMYRSFSPFQSNRSLIQFIQEQMQ